MRAITSLAFAVVSVLVLAASAAAQTSVRYYFVPVANSVDFGRYPKYVLPGDLGQGWNVGNWTAMDYGLESVFLVALTLDAAQHTTLTSQPDVLAVPSPISDTVSALALPTVQSKMEAANLPADWVTTAMTYQQVMSRSIRIIQFMQRFHGTFGQLFAGGATLDTRINQLPVNARQALNAAAQSMGANTSSISGTTLIRQALVIVADQILPDPILFGGVAF